MRGSVAAGLGALVLAAPRLAAACPSCAAQETPGTTRYWLLGAMIAIPYVVALVAIRVIRRLAAEPESHR